MLFYVRDRKHIGPKTHANALQKENMAMNAAYSKLNLELKEKILNSSDGRKLNGSCSAASGKDAPVTPPPKETPSENMSSKTNGGLAVDAKCESLMVPPTKAPMKDQSSMEINSSINGSIEVNISCNNTLNVVEEKNTSVLPNCSGPQDSLHKKEASSSVAMSSGMGKPSESAEKPLSGDKCKIDGAISEMVLFSYIVCCAIVSFMSFCLLVPYFGTRLDYNTYSCYLFFPFRMLRQYPW